MRNMSGSDRVAGEPATSTEGFRPTGRQIGGAVIVVLLIVFIAANNDTVPVSLVFVSVELPLWLVLTVTALLGVGVGMLLGSRRAKAKYKNR